MQQAEAADASEGGRGKHTYVREEFGPVSPFDFIQPRKVCC